MPAFVEPQLCKLVERAPPGPGWGHEVKFDGYRLQLRVEDGEAFLRCNVSSWYVEEQFRNYATLLTTMAQKNKHVTYVNISPAANTWPIIEAQACGVPVIVTAASSMTARNAVITPSAVTATVVGQHSHTRASTSMSAVCFHVPSYAANRTVMSPPP